MSPSRPPAYFPPLRFAALRRAVSARATAYAQSRNALDGALTGLSPYLTHGLIDMAELLTIWRDRLGLSLADPLCRQLAWRAFFRHTWRHHGDAILQDLGARPAGVRYAEHLSADIRHAATGVPAIDASVRALYASGHLHHQQRLWLASYIVHLRKIDWRIAADWLYGHLLDGDLASNHLSWQVVAGTFGAAPRLFNNEAVSCFAPELASPGSGIDRDYAELEALAARDEALPPEALRPLPIREPELLAHPPWSATPTESVQALLHGRRVALVHPWMLGRRPKCDIAIGLIHLPFHAHHPWSARRWEFVRSRMQMQCDAIWVGDLRHAQHWLTGAAEVFSRHTLNPEYLQALELAGIELLDEPEALPEPHLPCASFAAYFGTITRLEPSLLLDNLRAQVERLRRES